MSVVKRLLKEYSAAKEDPNPALDELRPENENNLFIWQAILKGPPDSPYEGGYWKIHIKIPQTYPLQPPSMKFLTKICHANIHLETGEVCIDVLKSQWTPAWTISSALTAVQAMLLDPEPDSPLNVDAANLVRCKDTKAYESLIRYYTCKYADRRRLVKG